MNIANAAIHATNAFSSSLHALASLRTATRRGSLT